MAQKNRTQRQSSSRRTGSNQTSPMNWNPYQSSSLAVDWESCLNTEYAENPYSTALPLNPSRPQKKGLAPRQKFQTVPSSSTEQELIRAIRQVTGKRHWKHLVEAVCLVALVTALFSGLMVRQARIFEMNFSNTRLVNQIQEQRETNERLSKSLLSQTDTSKIEGEALRLFGLRKPSQMQRVVMTLPETDKILFYENREGWGESQELSSFKGLEAYMIAQRGTESP